MQKLLYKIQRKCLKFLSRYRLTDFHKWRKNHGNLPTYSQHGQDLFVQYFYRNAPKNELFFVDIGANDGVSLSNTFALEKASWGGFS